LDKKIIDKLKESAKLNINKIETYEQPKNDDEAVMVDKEVIVDENVSRNFLKLVNIEEVESDKQSEVDELNEVFTNEETGNIVKFLEEKSQESIMA
jgi:hypothetical protein